MMDKNEIITEYEHKIKKMLLPEVRVLIENDSKIELSGKNPVVPSELKSLISDFYREVGEIAEEHKVLTEGLMSQLDYLKYEILERSQIEYERKALFQYDSEKYSGAINLDIDKFTTQQRKEHVEENMNVPGYNHEISENISKTINESFYDLRTGIARILDSRVESSIELSQKLTIIGMKITNLYRRYDFKDNIENILQKDDEKIIRHLNKVLDEFEEQMKLNEKDFKENLKFDSSTLPEIPETIPNRDVEANKNKVSDGKGMLPTDIFADETEKNKKENEFDGEELDSDVIR